MPTVKLSTVETDEGKNRKNSTFLRQILAFSRNLLLTEVKFSAWAMIQFGHYFATIYPAIINWHMYTELFRWKVNDTWRSFGNIVECLTIFLHFVCCTSYCCLSTHSYAYVHSPSTHIYVLGYRHRNHNFSIVCCRVSKCVGLKRRAIKSLNHWNNPIILPCGLVFIRFGAIWKSLLNTGENKISVTILWWFFCWLSRS